MITLESLRNAIGSQLGKELTPEVAAAIEMAAIDRADRSFKPEAFEPRSYLGTTFRVESFRAIVDEMHVLHEAHFAETELHMQGIALNPDYDYLFERERMGTMIQFTARIEGKLAGNIRFYVQRSTHTKHLVAAEDTFYLLQEARRGLVAIKFWRYAEDALASIGVREIHTDSKTVNKVHRLNEYLGYKHVANKYVKIFPESEA